MGFNESWGEFCYAVRVVRNPGEDSQKIQDDVLAVISKDKMIFDDAVEIKDGDYIYITDSRLPSEEPSIVIDHSLIPDPFGDDSRIEAKVVRKSKWVAQQEETKMPKQQFNFHGDVGSVAGGDIGSITNLNINATILLEVLEKAIEESEEIPPEEKKTLLKMVRGLSDNQFIKDISKTAIIEAIKYQFMPS